MLFNLIEDFVKKFAQRENNQESSKNGLDLMNNVYENFKGNLTESERRAFLVTVKYFETRNMKASS